MTGLVGVLAGAGPNAENLNAKCGAEMPKPRMPN